MTPALDQQARTALEQFVQRSRRLLEDDIAHEAEGRFGIHVADGQVENEDALHLDPTGLAARRDIVEILEFLRREEGSGTDAIARLIRETAFTHLNRIVAIRIAEAIGLLPESLARGPSSTGFKELLEVAPLLAHDASGGYWRYLRFCGDELAADLPQLFDPRNPLLELAPSVSAFDEVVELVRAVDLDAVWDAPDTLGWAYQFFNSGDERRAMRDQSASPRNSRELAVRNQFFTPRYVVDFLVHNSLGRRLLEADPTSALLADLPLLLDPPTEAGEPIALSEVRVLDPACGSGHFLLGAYDVLERAWELQGVSPEDAAPRIVSSLWGIDIDARCAQVAAAAVILRARRNGKVHKLPRPNIITARALPEPTEGWDTLLSSLPADRRQLVVAIRDALDQASVLGPLLKVEELLANEIRSRVVGATDDSSTLFGAMGVAQDAFGRAEAEVLSVLQHIADSATSGPADRLFVAEAQDAIRFVEAMRHRYDAVLMNPPFGEPVFDTREYLKSAYPWIPAKGFNLLAAFVGRALDLCRRGGYAGAITSRSGMFLTTYESWRRRVLLGQHLVVLADLGFGVMEQALVEAAAYVIRAESAEPGHSATFLRLLKDVDRPTALGATVSAARSGADDPRVFRVALADFDEVPGSPVAYWMSPSIRRLFSELIPMQEGGVDCRVGLQTSDDFRFVRAFWEVDSETVGVTRDEFRTGSRWAPLAKGGEYSPFWADVHLVVYWAENGREIKEFVDAQYPYLNGNVDWVVKNQDYYFRPGITWPERTTSGFCPQPLPAGCIIGVTGPGAFLDNPLDVFALVAVLGTRLARVLIAVSMPAGEETVSGTAARHYTVGTIQKLPLLTAGARPEVLQQLNDVGNAIATDRRKDATHDETSLAFVRPSLLDVEGSSLKERLLAAQAANEALVLDTVDRHWEVERLVAEGLSLDTGALRFVDEEEGRHPAAYSLDIVADDRFKEYYELTMSDLVGRVLDERGGSRGVATKTFVANRRLELMSHVFERHPKSIVDSRRRLRLLPPEEPRMSIDALFSYFVGCAFGRWDVRIGRDRSFLPPSMGLLDCLPSRPPGMLSKLQEVRSEAGRDDAALELIAKRVLVDEPGHEWDLEAAVHGVVDALFDDADSILAEALGILGRRTAREVLRKQFFKDHLKRYTKSRRKAPIYWPLTVPSGQWGVWVYAPMLSREVLYVVASEALRRERHAAAEIDRLQRERASRDPGRGVKAVDKALDDERKLSEELRRFREHADRVAALGWEPDLDDGVVLCAAPLADLFPMWKEPAQYRKELRAGKYEWATVARWADRL